MKQMFKILFAAVLVMSLPQDANAGWVNGYYRSDGTYVQGHWRSDSRSGNFGSGGIVNPSKQRVPGHFRRDGTYVRPHYRTSPNDRQRDNYSHWGNVNPNNGKRGYQKCPSGRVFC